MAYDERQAARYDAFYTTAEDRAENDDVRDTLAPLVAGRRVVDVGAGTGLAARLLAPSFYVAVDQSADMLAHLNAPGIPTVKVCGSVGDPFLWSSMHDYELEVGVCINAAHQFDPNTATAMICEMSRVRSLRRLIFHGATPVEDVTPWVDRIDPCTFVGAPEDYRDALTANGWELDESWDPVGDHFSIQGVR